MSEEKVLKLVKDLVKTYLEIRRVVDEVHSEFISSVLDVLDQLRVRKILLEALQDTSEQR